MKKIISSIIIICLLFSSVSTMVYAEDDTSLFAGYINTINAKTNESASYQGICKNNTIYMLPNDIATIGEYECEVLSIEKGTAENAIENSTILSKLYSELDLDKLFKKDNFEYYVFSRKDSTTDYITQIYYYDGFAQTMNKSFEIDNIEYDGQTYLNLEKMLYLMHTQWCIDESLLYYYPLDYNIFDFIGEKFSYMYENSVQHNSLLYDGENKWGHSTRIVLSHILNDVDMRIFIPFYGSDMIQQDWYEEAILQLATTDDSFIDDYGSEQISRHLKDSPYHKIETGLTAIDVTLGGIEDLSQKMSESKLSKFSKWNDFSTINTAQFEATQKKIDAFGDVVSVANILVDFNEINTRSKEWSNDFVNGLNILYTINEDTYGDYGKDILKVADNLLDEYETPTEKAAEAAMLDTYGLVLDKLLDKTIVGHIESIVSLSNAIIKSNPNCAEAIENADLMNTVHALINVENVFLNEFVDSYHDYLHYLGVEEGSSSLRLFELMYTSINENPQKEVETAAISDMRNALEMFLKTSLRNKTYVYHFSCFNKGGSLWTPTSEAKALESDIYKTYALLSELISTRDYDELLYLDETFDSMYSNEYGCIRDNINSNILSDFDNESSKELTEKDLKAKAEEYGTVSVWGYADYDGNDTSEAFAVITDENSNILKTIFVSSLGDVKTMEDDLNFAVYKSEEGCVRYKDGKGFFWADMGAHGSGYSTIVYSVKNNAPYILQISSDIQGFYQKDDMFYTTKNEFLSGGGHAYPEYELIYDSNTQEFSVGERINESVKEKSNDNFENTADKDSSIVGAWGRKGSTNAEYEFTSDGLCYWQDQKDKAGNYEILDDNTLVMTFSWTKNTYTFTDETFDEFREHSDGYFWYFENDVLTINGSKYYRNGKEPLNTNKQGDLTSILEGSWATKGNTYEYKFYSDGTYEENTIIVSSGTVIHRSEMSAGQIDISSKTSARLYQDTKDDFGSIQSYSELMYYPESDTISIGGSNNVFYRATYNN